MIDINFYMKFDSVVEKIKKDNITDDNIIFSMLENIRSKKPTIYNIETTNRCNMRCKMCPRTNLMTRPIQDIDVDTFIKIIGQLYPHSKEDWKKWCEFCKKKYGISENDVPSENHFFLYIISDVIQLHGFGEPALDRNIAFFVKLLTDRNLKTYFSTNPININMDQTIQLMENGLTYIKYCFDSIDDKESKDIRGKVNDFSHSYEMVKKVADYKKEHGLKTKIVITMINLAGKNQQEEYEKLCELFEDYDVYIYLKSENSQWYRKKFHGTQAIHGSEVCKHPWMTMTIKSNGEVAMCMDDYNNEIVLGDAKEKSLEDIWNDEKYVAFRREHLHGTNKKCTERCDLKTFNQMNYV